MLQIIVGTEGESLLPSALGKVVALVVSMLVSVDLVVVSVVVVVVSVVVLAVSRGIGST